MVDGAAVDWADAHGDILWNIIKRLPRKDYFRLGAVCVSWRAVLSRGLPPQIPCLMLPHSHGTHFFSLSQNQMSHLNSPLFTGNDCLCIGSSEGWLVTIDKGSANHVPELHISDPLSQFRLPLPSITTLPFIARTEVGYNVGCSSVPYEYAHEWIFRKVVLSPLRPAATFRPESFIVAAICSVPNMVAFARVGDESWTCTEIPRRYGYDHFTDLLFYKEQLLLLRRTGEVLACDISTDVPPRVTLVLPPPDGSKYSIFSGKFLVESCDGDLLQVWKQMFGSPEGVVCWTLIGRSEKFWAELKTLGNQFLFLGSNHSVALSAEDFPERKRNCIYFTDHRVMLSSFKRGLEVYNMEDRTIVPFFMEYHSSRPSWFIPKHAAITQDQQERWIC